MTERFELVDFIEDIEALQEDLFYESKGKAVEWLSAPNEIVNPHLKQAAELLTPVLLALKKALEVNDAWEAQQKE